MEAMKEEEFLRVENGYGYGYGDGYGSGSGITVYNGEKVHRIDGVETILRNIHGNVARGAILHSDLTLESCYVIRQGNTFAHGETLEKAQEALMEKLMRKMPEDERIDAFLQAVNSTSSTASGSPSPQGEGKKYPAQFFYDWHHRLTGSCEMGRKAFAQDHGIDLEKDEMTVSEFLELTKDAYGGSVIRRILGKTQ